MVVVATLEVATLKAEIMFKVILSLPTATPANRLLHALTVRLQVVARLVEIIQEVHSEMEFLGAHPMEDALVDQVVDIDNRYKWCIIIKSIGL